MAQASRVPKVSVIVTTYNRAALLPRAVDSVLAQTYEDFELIIVDDCSTDDTPEVMQSFADPRIRTARHQENKGHSSALNTGIALARGDSIGFLDDDDEWVGDKLSRQMRTLEACDPRVGLVYSWFDRVTAGSGVRRPGGRSVISGDISEAMLGWALPAPPSTYLVRTEAARAIGGFDAALTMANDRDFLSRLSMHWHVAVVPDVLMLMHEGHRRSEHWPTALESQVRYIESHIRRFDEELRERPSTFAQLLRVLAIAEIRRGNMRGAPRAYLKALMVDTHDTLRATTRNLGFVCVLLWERLRSAVSLLPGRG